MEFQFLIRYYKFAILLLYLLFGQLFQFLIRYYKFEEALKSEDSGASFNSSLGIINSLSNFSSGTWTMFQFLIRYYKFVFPYSHIQYLGGFNSSLGIINQQELKQKFEEARFNSSLGIINKDILI